MDEDALVVDGNATAGMLSDAFAFEVTMAVGVCVGCGARRAIGAVPAWTRAPGVVLRCPDCDQVLLRAARTGPRLVLDLRGLRSLTIELGD
jgi:Family of unknown function (DUF6510)